ncbi:dTDP-4-dehydrorhamnose 3,5-epimerase family protein [Candidatus Curtissbacteria bacterium]|nr:dTDP-4-dehydrorhamnose 3,5-epimerase family protein [Candidatus Curtissbacteria bacterium]
MNYSYITLSDSADLIEGVILKKLTVHKDKTGRLFETLRKDWADVFNTADLNFAMQYLSITPSGVVRDEDQWHVHKFQKDRFICAAGRIVTAIFDPRGTSRTKGKLNLFLMGPEKEQEMYVVVIPENTYHGFMVVSRESGYLLNFPTKLYNPRDEGRVDNTQLDWGKVRLDFGISSE